MRIYIYIYTYIYTHCTVITWPHSSLFWVNNLATVEPMTWPPSRKTCFIVLFECTVFREWCAKLFFGKVVFCQVGVFRKWVVAIFWGVGGGGGGDCCCVMLLDALERCSKNPTKIVFLSTLLLDASKHPETKGKKGKNVYTLFGAALKAYRHLFHFKKA